MRNSQHHVKKVIIEDKDMKSDFIKGFKEYLKSNYDEFSRQGCNKAIVCVAIEKMNQNTGDGESCISLAGDTKLLTEAVLLLLDNNQVFEAFREVFFERMAKKIYEENAIKNSVKHQRTN